MENHNQESDIHIKIKADELCVYLKKNSILKLIKILTELHEKSEKRMPQHSHIDEILQITKNSEVDRFVVGIFDQLP